MRASAKVMFWRMVERVLRRPDHARDQRKVVGHQGDIGGFDRRVGSRAAHRDGEVARARAGAPLTPSPIIATCPSRASRSSIAGTLSSAAARCGPPQIPSSRGDLARGAGVVAGQHDDPQTEGVEVGDQGLGFRAASRRPRRAGRRRAPSLPTTTIVRPPGRQLLDKRSRIAGVCLAALREQPRRAQPVERPAIRAMRALARQDLEPLGQERRHLARLGIGADRGRDRMLARRLERRHPFDQLLLVVLGQRHHLDHRSAARG